MSDDRSDEGRSTPSVPDSGEGEPVETTDDQSDDERPRDPAGVGDPSRDDATGLSGQPEADEFEGPADWSDVDDTTEETTTGEAASPVEEDSQTQTPVREEGETGTPTEIQRANEPAVREQGAAGNERGPDEVFCQNCGAVISQQAVICPECGVEQTATSQSSGSNDGDPAVAALLSGIGLLFPIATGAGQVYNGQVGKGVVFSLVQMVNAVLIFVVIGIVTYPLLGFFAMYDAYSNAEG